METVVVQRACAVNPNTGVPYEAQFVDKLAGAQQDRVREAGCVYLGVCL